MILNVKTLAFVLVTVVDVYSEAIASKALEITRQCIFTSKPLLVSDLSSIFDSTIENEDEKYGICNVEFTIPKGMDIFEVSINYTGDPGNRIQVTTYQDKDIVDLKNLEAMKSDETLHYSISVTPKAYKCKNFKLEITKPKNENTVITSLQIFVQEESFEKFNAEIINCNETVTADKDKLELLLNEENVNDMSIETISNKQNKTNNVVKEIRSERYKSFKNVGSGGEIWNPLTISIVSIAAAAILGVTIVSAYYCGKKRTLDKEFYAADINVDAIEPPSTITVPRVTNYYVDLHSERLSRANSYN